jgi:hypothetical protein
MCIAFHWNPLSLTRLSLSFIGHARAEGAAVFHSFIGGAAPSARLPSFLSFLPFFLSFLPSFLSFIGHAAPKARLSSAC